MPQPLGLSDQELGRLMNAAALLPPAARDAFLRSVANRVADLPQIGAAEIEAAIAFVLAGYGVVQGPRGAPALLRRGARVAPAPFSVGRVKTPAG